MTLNFDHSEIYELLLQISSHFQVDPSSSIEAENYFRNLLKSYQGNPDVVNIQTWLADQISKKFVALGKRPKWIQGFDWQYIDDKPMIFIGQIDILLSQVPEAKTYFHDDTSFYVFMSEHGEKYKVVKQQY